MGAIALVAVALLLASSSRKGGGGGVRIGEIIDLTDESANVVYSKGSVAGIRKRERKRDMRNVTGITLHQVGVADVGDSAVPKMTYHLIVHEGSVFLIHPFNTYLYSSHRFNAETVAISVSGNYGPNTPLSPEDQDALRRAIAYAKKEIGNQGGDPKWILAHRQSAAERAADPGPAIWKAGALWAEKHLGMKTVPDYFVDTGNPIPSSWKESPGIAGRRACLLCRETTPVSEIDDVAISDADFERAA